MNRRPNWGHIRFIYGGGPATNPTGAPHPRFPVEFRGFPELHAALLKESRTRGPVQSCVQEIRGISLVFREMWDSTALAPHLPQQRGCSLGQAPPFSIKNRRHR
jgi:hypothetical protein